MCLNYVIMTSEKLWKAYHTDILRFIFSLVKNEQISKDLTQETFIKAHVKLETLKDASKVKAWLFSIARYTTMDYFKKSAQTTSLKDYDIIDDYSEEKEHSAKDCLPGIIKHLPKKYRDPLFMSDIKGIKQTEIANQLHLPLATIKSQIQRARKLITKGYMDCCDYKLNEDGFLTGETKEKGECKVCN